MNISIRRGLRASERVEPERNPDPEQPWGEVYRFPALPSKLVSASCSRAKTHQALSVDAECIVPKMQVEMTRDRDNARRFVVFEGTLCFESLISFKIGALKPFPILNSISQVIRILRFKDPKIRCHRHERRGDHPGRCHCNLT